MLPRKGHPALYMTQWLSILSTAMKSAIFHSRLQWIDGNIGIWCPQTFLDRIALPIFQTKKIFVAFDLVIRTTYP